MGSNHYHHIKVHKRSSAYFVAGLFLLLGAVLVFFRATASAAISYDPYADSVVLSTSHAHDPQKAVGAPNQTYAKLAGGNANILLDMGAGEEGTQTVRVFFGQITTRAKVSIRFLDSNKGTIATENRQIGITHDPTVQNFSYNWTNFDKAYRYVEVIYIEGGKVSVDAVAALGYIGSSPDQDTDGDRVSDRDEQAAGTNPLVFNSQTQTRTSTQTQTGPAPAPPGSDETNSNASAQVNAPPASSDDKDGDGIPNKYELQYGLDPTNAEDASADSDDDGLSNLTEYQIGSNIKQKDSDGDGMPDMWEYENGLDINKNDAERDPDGDYLTNLGEYRHGTDPHSADDLYKTFAARCLEQIKRLEQTDWLWLLLLVGAALIAWVASMATGPLEPPKRGSSRWYRLRYRFNQKFKR